MAEAFCDQQRGETHLHQQACVGVPLRYNNDKPEESRICKGFQGFKPDF